MKCRTAPDAVFGKRKLMLTPTTRNKTLQVTKGIRSKLENGWRRCCSIRATQRTDVENDPNANDKNTAVPVQARLSTISGPVNVLNIVKQS